MVTVLDEEARIRRNHFTKHKARVLSSSSSSEICDVFPMKLSHFFFLPLDKISAL